MNPTLFEIGVAALMVTVSVALIVWFLRDMAAASERRMMKMMTRAGGDGDDAKHGDIAAIAHDVWSRCRRCRSEDLCDRWLARSVEGDNSFCPNAQLFRTLPKTAGRIAD
jgi:hypothetical protein